MKKVLCFLIFIALGCCVSLTCVICNCKTGRQTWLNTYIMYGYGQSQRFWGRINHTRLFIIHPLKVSSLACRFSPQNSWPQSRRSVPFLPPTTTRQVLDIPYSSLYSAVYRSSPKQIDYLTLESRSTSLHHLFSYHTWSQWRVSFPVSDGVSTVASTRVQNTDHVGCL